MKDVSPAQAYAIAIIENIQRKQLNILEEAEAFKRLKSQYNFSNAEVAKSVGRNRTSVANLIRLSEDLCEEGKALLLDKKIDFGHARTVLTLPSDEQASLLKLVCEKQLSVRKLEKVVSLGGAERVEPIKLKKAHDKNISSSFSCLARRDVKVQVLSSGKLEVTLSFNTEEEGEDFFHSLSFD